MDEVQAVEPVLVSAEEWCARASGSDRRIELLGAFHAEEVAAGRLRDAPEAYAARYAAFADRPA